MRLFKPVVRSFSSYLPVVDAGLMLSKSPKAVEECRKAVDVLHKTGLICFKDPRINEQENEEFIDMMERYFESRSDFYSKTGELLEKGRQGRLKVGLNKDMTECSRDHRDVVSKLYPQHHPVTPQPPPKDRKWKYVYRVADESDCNEDPVPRSVIPQDFIDWEEKFQRYGTSLRESCFTASEMIALGLGVDQSTFTNKLKGGHHFLNPMASDLLKCNRLGEVLNGFHYDINFLTINGKSRYPGLTIWLRNGEISQVKIPKGCFLIQAGKQLEIMTAGYIPACFHEVVVTDNTLAAAQKKITNGKSHWRVSSTLFSNIRDDVLLKPLDIFRGQKDYHKYPPVLSTDQIQEEVMAKKSTAAL